MTVRAATLGQVVCIICCIISDVTNKASRWRFLCVLQTNLFLLVCKAKKSDHIHPILETLHWLWNSPSVSVWSFSTLYSSKTIMICIRHMNLCHPSCKHKNIWWKIVFLHWPICLEQFASWKAFYCADHDFCKRWLYPQEVGWRGVGWESTHWNPFEMNSFNMSQHEHEHLQDEFL